MASSAAAPAADPEQLRHALDAGRDAEQRALESLVEIPSVSAAGFPVAEVSRCAAAVAEVLETAGYEHTAVLEVPGGPYPAVYAEWLHAGAEAPTVLLYAHHDVQPPGELEAWSSPPFSPTLRDGRLYGRGTADDKAGVLVHAAALAAWLRAAGGPPVNVKVIVEGEEEIGSPHLGAFLAAHTEQLTADAVVLTDAQNWRVGEPAVTHLLRGLVDCTVELRALDHPLHSGMYGGAVPDALTGLCRLLGELTDAHGSVAIPGFADDAHEPTPAEREQLAALDPEPERFRTDAGLVAGAALTGDPQRTLLERLWLRPALTVIGLDAPPVASAANALTPVARARVSVRLAPGQDPQRAQQRLTEWLHAQTPWGLEITVTPGWSAEPFRADPQGPVHAAAATALSTAFGAPAVFAGMGGTIPFVEPFTRSLGGVPALLTGVADPQARIHGTDESVHVEDWRRACLGEALLFAELAALPREAFAREPA